LEDVGLKESEKRRCINLGKFQGSNGGQYSTIVLYFFQVDFFSDNSNFRFSISLNNIITDGGDDDDDDDAISIAPRGCNVRGA